MAVPSPWHIDTKKETGHGVRAPPRGELAYWL